MAQAINGFDLVSNIGDRDVFEQYLGIPSTQYVKKAAMQFINNRLANVDAQDDVVSHIYQNMVTFVSDLRPATADLTTTRGEQIKAVPVGDLIWECDFESTSDDDI